jgi:hypothetical protein
MSEPTMIDGVFRAEAGLAKDRPIDMEAKLHMLDRGRNPNFEKLTRKFGAKVAKSRSKFEWRRRDPMPLTCKITAVDAAGTSNIEVDNFQFIHRDDLLFNTRTGELMVCNEDAGQAPTADVEIRSYTHTTPGTAELRYATAIGDVINILGESHAEGEDAPEAFKTEGTADFDYIMQKDRRAAHISDIAEAEAEYSPTKARAMDNLFAMISYHKQINMLYYLSQTTREVLSASGPRRHALGGLKQKIVSNKMSFAGVGPGLTPQAISEVLRKTTYHDMASETKVSLAGQYAHAAMSAWPVGSVRVSPRAEEWGYNIKRIITGHGELDVAYDPQLTDETGLGGVMVILDPAHVRQTFLNGMGIKLIKKVSNLSTIHSIVDVITGTVGLQCGTLEEMHAWLEDIT